MKDLIAKLEAATEGSRKLSDAVLLACGWQFVDRGDARENHWRDPKGNTYEVWNDPHCRYVASHKRPSPTESLDAALTLVEPGWLWAIQQGLQCGAAVWTLGSDFEGKGYTVDKPALALTIAALKARSAQ